MNDFAMGLVRAFADEYVKAGDRILDVGSLNYNGCHREIFAERGCEYVGLDVVAGDNVDFVPASHYQWDELKDDSFDVVVSGQTFEHIEYPWLTICEMARVLKPGGHIYVGAPSIGSIHHHPLDCWRINPDGMMALAKWARLEVLSIGTDERDTEWRTTYLIGRKPA